MTHKLLEAKKRLITMHFRQQIGHIGGNLSALDTMMVLHHEVMQPEDTFILSKGHAAGALYITLWSLNKLSDADLETFHRDNTKLAGHPCSGWHDAIPVVTGSLGHGLSFSLGIALSRKLSNTPGHIYCLMSDGEWQEGSNWEALIFFAHHQLKNITVLIDLNGLQGFGNTQDIASMGDLPKKLKAFGFDVIEIDGHNLAAIQSAIEHNPGSIIILNTVKGHGISFMENRMEWHYLPLSSEQYQEALNEIETSATLHTDYA